MNIQADISWIQKEIAKINDPDLINVFKSLLKYREKKTTDDALDMFLERSLKDLDEGRTTPHTEVRKKYDKWLYKLDKKCSLSIYFNSRQWAVRLESDSKDL